MKTNRQLLGLAILLAIFTGACASVEDEGRASSAPPTVIVERERAVGAPPAVVIEKESDDDDKEIKVEVDED